MEHEYDIYTQNIVILIVKAGHYNKLITVSYAVISQFNFAITLANVHRF